MTGKGVWTLAAAMAVSSTPQDRPSFRANADFVQIDVSVQRGGRTVTGLTAADFELSDTGVAQRIERVTNATLALDIVLVVDCSPSMARADSEWLARGVRGITSLKAPPDRIQVVAFSTAAKLVPLSPTIECDGRAQGTAMFDAAIAAALLPSDGRKRVIVVLTDGAETTSLLPRQSRLQITDRSSALLYIIALTTDHAVRQEGAWLWTLEGYWADVDWELRELAERTGGEFLAVPPKKDFVDTMRQALDDARLRYVLQYVPEGVPSAGWHEVEVKLKRPPRADVRAKRGYWR